MSDATITGLTSAAVATGGTVTGAYPAGTTRGDFVLGARHRLNVIGKSFAAPEAITVALGASLVTVTYNGATTIPAFSRFTIELDRNGLVNPLTTNQAGTDKFIVPGLPTIASAAFSARHGCALSLTTGVYCWGDNDRGQIGNGQTSSRTLPVIALP